MKLLVNDPAEKFIKEPDNRLEKTKNLSGQTADCVLIRSCNGIEETFTENKSIEEIIKSKISHTNYDNYGSRKNEIITLVNESQSRTNANRKITWQLYLR